MSIIPAELPKLEESRLAVVVKSLLGMSRAPVAIFVVAHAGLAAIFALGTLPSFRIMGLGILASLTGTGALIGMNDLWDVELDKRKIAYADERQTLDLGSTFIHHPIARGTISMATGVTWVVLLSIASLALMEAIRPGLWPILVVIAVLVTLYSKLSPITYWKFLTVASAVTLGAVAGWLAVAEVSVSLSSFSGWLTVIRSGGLTLALFAAWSFVWEVGGRNIPNDFNDVEEDRPLGTKTIPSVLGERTASRVVLVMLLLTTVLSVLLVWSARWTSSSQLVAVLGGVVVIDFYMLLLPAVALAKQPSVSSSVRLYNRSALYTLALLLVLMLILLIR